MPSSAEKLLERMRNSKAGWRRGDLDRLYLGFDFIIEHRKRHDIAKHRDYPTLRATLPRHNEIGKAYVNDAVDNIDLLLVLKEKDNV